MLDNELLEAYPDPLVGLFGDKNYPYLGKGKGIENRREYLGKLTMLLKELEPKTVYLIPETGLCQSALVVLQGLKIPYVVVNPYKGYFDNVTASSKLRLLLGLENSKAVVVVGDAPKDIKGNQKAVEDAQDFIIERAEVVISVYGDDPDENTKIINQKLHIADTNVIFVDCAKPQI